MLRSSTSRMSSISNLNPNSNQQIPILQDAVTNATNLTQSDVSQINLSALNGQSGSSD